MRRRIAVNIINVINTHQRPVIQPSEPGDAQRGDAGPQIHELGVKLAGY